MATIFQPIVRACQKCSPTCKKKKFVLREINHVRLLRQNRIFLETFSWIFRFLSVLVVWLRAYYLNKYILIRILSTAALTALPLQFFLFLLFKFLIISLSFHGLGDWSIVKIPSCYIQFIWIIRQSQKCCPRSCALFGHFKKPRGLWVENGCPQIIS